MPLYPFTHRKTGDITLVEAKSRERAAQAIAEQTYSIGEIVKGGDAARMMKAGATFIDEDDPVEADPDFAEVDSSDSKAADPAPTDGDEGDQD